MVKYCSLAAENAALLVTTKRYVLHVGTSMRCWFAGHQHGKQ